MAIRIKLLVIEDDPDLREVYKGLFARDDRFVVRSTQDGAHGASLLRTEAFDVAIIDIRLPTMNGLQVAAVARSSKLKRPHAVLKKRHFAHVRGH